MKNLFAALFLASTLLMPVAAYPADKHAGHAMTASKAADSSMSDGTIKKVDKAAGKVTIAHGPLANLNMPAMTMVFRVKEAAWLDQMKAGDKVRFLSEEVNGALTLVRFEAAK